MITDSDTIAKVQRKMTEAVEEMKRMAPDVATARQVKEFSDDRKKRMLSVLVVEQLKDGKSVAAAEHYARATNAYGSQLNDLMDQYRAAVRKLEESDAFRVQYEAARSLLSLEKEKIRL